MPKFDVAESIIIDAELSKVRGIVRDFKQWVPWSPWLSAEPDCLMEYATDGDSYSWDGRIIGSGRMELLKEEDTALWYHLAFLTPWKSESDVDFQFEKSGESTRVTWRMKGSLPFFMFFMKKMMSGWIGADYRRGLSKLKDYVEQGNVPSVTEFPGLGDGLVSPYIGLEIDCTIDDIGPQMSEKYGWLNEWMESHNVGSKGSRMAICHTFDIVTGRMHYTAAMPVSEIPADLPGDFKSGSVEAPQTFKVKHTGAYRHLGSAWSAGMMHERAKKFRPEKGVEKFEIYLNDPLSTAESELITEIHFPAR